MADRSKWEIYESASKICATAVIPVVLGLIGFFVNAQLDAQKRAIEEERLKQQMLTRAIEVVFSKDKEKMFGSDVSLETRRAYRSHWVETYNTYAQVKLSDEFIALMMEQDTIAGEKEVWTVNNKPQPPISKTEGTQGTDENELGDGWVAVGRFGTARYSDRNFDIVGEAAENNGSIKPGTIIRTRWSVSLRTNIHNVEDRINYASPVRGIVWGGQCAKVIDSLTDSRSQTWTFIEIVPCPATTKS
jgi:hypothetical protein